MEDLISRQSVLDVIHLFFTEEVYKIPTEKTEDGDVLVMSKIQPFLTMNKTLSRRIKELPSVPAEQTHEEWCTDCKEYDQEQHCCHRYCKIIRQAVAEIKQAERTGHWIERPEIETSTPDYLMFYECSECGDKQCFCKSDIHKKRFCSNCGARMESEE